jgi:hypothetical protein
VDYPGLRERVVVLQHIYPVVAVNGRVGVFQLAQYILLRLRNRGHDYVPNVEEIQQGRVQSLRHHVRIVVSLGSPVERRYVLVVAGYVDGVVTLDTLQF